MQTAPSRSDAANPTPGTGGVLAGTPGPGRFAPGLSQPLTAAASIWLAGKLTYVYKLTHPPTHGHTWCAGRYELNVVPDYSGRSQAFASQDHQLDHRANVFTPRG
jgi:hypothetical protein